MIVVSATVEQHDYIYASGKLLRETYGDTVLDFFYDSKGTPYAFKYNDTFYYYITNLQGDVLYIVDAAGTTVASYEYDPYGQIISQTGDIAEINPLRYRSYYHDSETGFYYLQSRYYDPKLGRFINADSYASTGQGILGTNMFAYCLNNPVSMVDYLGEDAIYVANTTTDGGLPLVGHAILYIQDENGTWYKTHFTGPSSNKSEARIYTELPSDEEMEQINQILNGEFNESGMYYIHIEGDFSESVNAAKNYHLSDYGGYQLAMNNCMHYAREILCKGRFKNNALRKAAQDFSGFAPIGLYHALKDSETAKPIKGWTGVSLDVYYTLANWFHKK